MSNVELSASQDLFIKASVLLTPLYFDDMCAAVRDNNTVEGKKAFLKVCKDANIDMSDTEALMLYAMARGGLESMVPTAWP